MSIVFSVVTITYNASAVLQRTLDSVMEQQYEGVEHIIVDGASTDGTVRMAMRYKERSDAAGNGHTVSVASEPDRGLYDAMNKGLQRASGHFIIYMNAGDTFADAHTLKRVAIAAEDTPGDEMPAVVYGDTDIVDSKGRYLRHRRLHPGNKLTWRSFTRGMLVCHQAFYARLDLAKRTPYDTRFRYSADVDWCIRIMKLAAQQHLPLTRVYAVTAFYMEEGQTTMHHKESLRERFAVMRDHYGLPLTVVMHGWFALRNLFSR